MKAAEYNFLFVVIPKEGLAGHLPGIHYLGMTTIKILRIRAMHEAYTALLDILVDNLVIIPSFLNRTSAFLNNGL